VTREVAWPPSRYGSPPTPDEETVPWSTVAKPAVSSVIFGARSIEQLDDNLKTTEVKLSPEDVKRLDDASAFDLGYPYKFIANLQKRW
jgi:diketogulonate reductase-like aldo/keto reductase